MLEDSFGNIAETIGSGEFVADFRHRCEFPGGIVVEGVQIESALEEESGFFRELRKRILESVVDRGEKTGTELDAEQCVGEFHSIADFESGGAFEDLEVGPGASDADHFAFKPDIADDGERDFVLSNVGIEFDGQQIAVHSDDPSHFLVFEHIL